jgi:predicted O-methyltransferase YrrM
MGRLLVSGDEAKPWLVYGATDFLEHTISPKARILELGGGGSTVFWLNRGNQVVTIENNSEWFGRMNEVVGTNPNWKPYLVEEISVTSLEDLNLGKFDVVVNDFIGDRSKLSKWIENSVSPGGFIVWDNSDRASETVALDNLKKSGFGHIDFFGLSPINSFALQTTVLSRSLAAPNWKISRKNAVPY